MEDLATELRSQELWEGEGIVTTLPLSSCRQPPSYILREVLLSNKLLPSFVFPAKKPPGKKVQFQHDLIAVWKLLPSLSRLISPARSLN